MVNGKSKYEKKTRSIKIILNDELRLLLNLLLIENKEINTSIIIYNNNIIIINKRIKRAETVL